MSIHQCKSCTCLTVDLQTSIRLLWSETVFKTSTCFFKQSETKAQFFEMIGWFKSDRVHSFWKFVRASINEFSCSESNNVAKVWHQYIYLTVFDFYWINLKKLLNECIYKKKIVPSRVDSPGCSVYEKWPRSCLFILILTPWIARYSSVLSRLEGEENLLNKWILRENYSCIGNDYPNHLPGLAKAFSLWSKKKIRSKEK